MTTLKEVRVASWEALRSQAWADDYPLYCAMQDRHEDVHVGVYCNALSHLEALDEILYYASWCDDITLEGIQGDEPASERLLRSAASSVAGQHDPPHIRVRRSAGMRGKNVAGESSAVVRDQHPPTRFPRSAA